MKTHKAIAETARNHGVSEQQVREEMQKALDAAWSTTDEAVLKRQRELFPKGKPSLEEFIRKISQMTTDI